MKPGLLSTYEVAAMLKVNESTVKRWTDKSLLRCIKTPGGHRKYKMNDVVDFMEHHSYDVTDLIIPDKERRNTVQVSTDYAILTKDFSVLKDLFFNTVIEGNRENTFQFLHLLYANRITQIELFDNVVFPAFAKIGMMWMTKELSIQQEHLASSTAHHAILKLQDHITKMPRHGGIALCGCLEREYHEIGITCVNNVLESNGWSTYYLGANLPVESFIDAIENYVPDIICLSATTPVSQKQLIKDCARIYETARIIHAKVIVGGGAVSGAAGKRIAADHLSNSVADVMEYVQTLDLKKKNGP